MQMTQKSSVFVRDSTGFVKQVGLYQSVMLNLGNMSAGAALVSTALFALGPYAGGNVVLASIIAFLFAIPQLYVYTTLTRDFPRTGGDYVWASRILNPAVATTLAVAFLAESAGYFALIATSAVTTFASGIGVISFTQNNPSLGTIAGNISTGTSLGIIAIVIFGLIVLANILRPRAGYAIVGATGVIAIVATFIAFALLIGPGRSGFESGINSLFASAGSSSTYVSVVSQQPPLSFSWSNTLYLIPFLAIFTYPWMNAAPSVASEFRNSKTVSRYNLLISLLVTAIIVTVGFAAMSYAIGDRFLASASNNAFAAAAGNWPISLIDAGVTPNFLTYVLASTSNATLQWVITIGFSFWYVAILAYGVIVSARYLFAMSFDRVLPSQFANLSSRFRSPITAYVAGFLITGAITEVAVTNLAGAQSLFAIVVLAMVWYGFIGLAAIVYPSKKNLWERSTAFKEKVGGLPIISVAGAIMLIFFAWLGYLFITQTPLNGLAYIPSFLGLNATAFAEIFSIGSIVVGALIYAVSYYYHKGKSININMAYAEIPPE